MHSHKIGKPGKLLKEFLGGFNWFPPAPSTSDCNSNGDVCYASSRLFLHCHARRAPRTTKSSSGMRGRATERVKGRNEVDGRKIGSRGPLMRREYAMRASGPRRSGRGDKLGEKKGNARGNETGFILLALRLPPAYCLH